MFEHGKELGFLVFYDDTESKVDNSCERNLMHR
jgi:hypothetical protein